MVAVAVAAEGATARATSPSAGPTTFSDGPPVSTAGGVVTRSAHVSFEGCNARHVTLRVTIAKDPFPIGQAVTYEVSVTNTGATACGRPQTSIPPLRRALTIGPCGVLSGVVANAAGLDLYPGKEIFGCPLYWGVHLGAHATIKAEGTWMGYEALSGGPRRHHRMAKGATRSLQRDRRQRGQRPLPVGGRTQRSLGTAADAARVVEADGAVHTDPDPDPNHT